MVIKKHIFDALSFYSRLAINSNSPAERAGRKLGDEQIEAAIWRDIQNKLLPSPGQRILDIGVGSGSIAKQWVALSQHMSLHLHFVDFPAVINRLRSELEQSGIYSLDQCEFTSGIFPQSVPKELLASSFDRVVLYSVIHYSDTPREMIDRSAMLLAPGGRMLIGDIPNLDKKGRFLSTKTGRAFDANYKKIEPESLRLYPNYREFTSEARTAGAPPIDDDFILDVICSYRKKGFQAYVLEQPDGLSLNHTREDILICAPHE